MTPDFMNCSFLNKSQELGQEQGYTRHKSDHQNHDYGRDHIDGNILQQARQGFIRDGARGI
jgi:hypothetical protein